MLRGGTPVHTRLRVAAAAAATSTRELPFERCVFVNCPFDDDFLPLLHALVFAIHVCGFIARIAVEDTGSNETRLGETLPSLRRRLCVISMVRKSGQFRGLSAVAESPSWRAALPASGDEVRIHARATESAVESVVGDRF